MLIILVIMTFRILDFITVFSCQLTAQMSLRSVLIKICLFVCLLSICVDFSHFQLLFKNHMTNFKQT